MKRKPSRPQADRYLKRLSMSERVVQQQIRLSILRDIDERVLPDLQIARR